MIKVLIGDIFSTNCQTLVNTVNCVGIMGKGIALEFKKRYPHLFDDYEDRCKHGMVKLGEPYLYTDLGGAMVINFPTKDHWRSPARLSYIEKGLDHFLAKYREWNITSIAFPPLGCGNGGLDWSEVGPIMYQKLRNLGIDIEIYAPFGTPKTQLTDKFLSALFQPNLEDKGRSYKKLNPEWIVLMEVLEQLGEQPYANPVGRTIFQKICYIITEMGVQTGFEFHKGSYGPFDEQVKLALNEFANRNWIIEQQLGRMISIRASSQYRKERKQYITTINKYIKKIDKTVDLFCRIKDTEQAEELMTVLYASRQIKKTKEDKSVSEQELFDFILNWKSTWNSPEKRNAVADAIRNLTMLEWVRLEYSPSLEQYQEQEWNQ